VRRDQGQAPAPVRKTEPELLGDHATHRNADDVRSVPREVVQNPNRILGHCRDRSKKWPAVAVTDPQMIVVAATMIALELVHLRSPDSARHPEAHDEEDRRALLAEELVRQARRRLGKMRTH
jgi:hypothetical protein